MAQQRSQQGLSNLVGAGTTLGLGALQNRKKKNTTDPNNTGNTGQVGGLLNFLEGYGGSTGDPANTTSSPDNVRNPNLELSEGQTTLDFLDEMDSRFRPQSQEQGGVVQKTPGEFDHDSDCGRACIHRHSSDWR